MVQERLGHSIGLMMKCNGCKKELPKNGDSVLCSKCNHQYHFKCSSLSESSWRSMSNPRKADWKCVKCRGGYTTPPVSDHRKDLRSRSASLSSTRSIDETRNMTDGSRIESVVESAINKILDKYLKKMDQKFQDYERSLEFNMERMEELATTVKTLQKQMVTMEKVQEKVDTENKELKTKIRGLEGMVHELSQQGENCKLELSGFPNSEVNVEQVARELLVRLDIGIEEIGNFEIHKLTKVYGQQLNKTSIIIKYNSQNTRNKILNRIRAKKVYFKVGDLLKNNDTTSVYINEYLTKYYRKLFFEAKKLKTEKKFAYLWVKNGQILLKKTQESRVIQLTNMDDLGKL